MAGVAVEWGVEVVNENGEHLVDMCGKGALLTKHLSAQTGSQIYGEKEG